jgi:hypothetical protein
MLAQAIHSPPQLKTDQLSQNFIIINNTKFLGIVTENIIDTVTLKMVLFKLLRNTFK